MYKPRNQSARPFPASFAHRGPFNIIASQQDGDCNYFEQTFRAPLTNSEMAVAIRAHEYMHLKWDREHTALRQALTTFPTDIMMAGLDVAVNTRLTKHGVSIKALPWVEIKEDLPRRDTILLAIREKSLGKNYYTKKCSKEDQRAIKDIFHYLTSEVDKHFFSGVLALSNLIAEDLKELDETEKAMEFMASEGKGKTVHGGKEGEGIPWSKIKGIMVGSRNRWGKMIIEHLKPPVASTKISAYQRGKVNGFFGGFSQPHRALLPAMDGQAWHRRKRLKGGSLLIDVSGSMRFSQSEIEACIEQNPALTCAMYSGIGDMGKLQILCHKGKKVTHLPEKCGGCNVIDGPALKWLAEQPEPRVWLSDGHVTGINDGPCDILTREAEAIVRISKITRADDMRDAKRVLEK